MIDKDKDKKEIIDVHTKKKGQALNLAPMSPVDAESYCLTFTPRNPKKSKWSKPNKERAERMIQQGLMTDQGQKVYNKSNPNPVLGLGYSARRHLSNGGV